jgi:cytochrome c551/c552
MLHDPKKLTETIELDYVRRPGRRPLKIWIQWLTLVVALTYVAWTWLPGNRRVYQADSVSVAHTLFNQDCNNCHDRAFRPLARLFGGNAGHHSVSDQTCTTCHPGPDHHPPYAMATGCVECHREHRGRAMLAHVSNNQCTKCHADIKAAKSETNLENVADFFDNHPEFALWRTSQPDAGTVNFNHQVHLNLTAREGLRDIDKPLIRLKKQGCGSCHQIDSAGRYMQPIQYDHHCKECHPLLVQVKMPGPAWTKTATHFAKQPLPHPGPGQKPEIVRAALRERFVNLVRHHPEMAAENPAEDVRPFPGKGQFAPATKDQMHWVNRQMLEAERMLFDGADGCRRCHQEVKHKPLWRPKGLPDYGMPKIPTRWLEKSQFNHHSHRLLDCLECHAQAASSTKAQDVLMPKIDDCRQCHKPQGGARTDCFECHTFHSRQGPHWQGKRTIKEFTWPNK